MLEKLPTEEAEKLVDIEKTDQQNVMDGTEWIARIAVWLLYTFVFGLHTYRCFAFGLFIIGVGMFMNIFAATTYYWLIAFGVSLYGIGMGLVAGEPFNMAISNTP